MIFDDKDKSIIAAAMQGKNILIHGPGGVGKSVLIGEIARLLKEDDRAVAVTATTGTAAVNIKGTTIHRFAGIGKGDDDINTLLARVGFNQRTKNRWNSTSTVIIDEISMMGATLFDKIECIARKLRGGRTSLMKKEEDAPPFGGVQVIISGDFLQLPPIKDGWIFQCNCWKSMDFKVFDLRTSKRYEDREHFSMLLRLREAFPTVNDLELLRSRHDEYKRLSREFPDWEIQPTVLYSHKADVHRYNEEKLDAIIGEPHIFKAVDSIIFRGRGSEEQKVYYKKVLDDTIPDLIVLKVGAQVILKFNLDVESGLVNGSRGIVTEINAKAKLVTVKFLNGVLSPIGYNIWDSKDDDAIVSRQQMPLILAWASSIHSSQGQTLDLAICDIGDSIFSPAQAYVAISRLKNVEGLYLSDFDPDKIRCDETAFDFVRTITEVTCNPNVDIEL